MDNLDTASQEVEFKKCAESFAYFCETYVRIEHPLRGLIPFKLYDFQKRYVELIESKRFLINKKFRQGGFSTVNAVWLLWLSMFKLDKRSMIATKTDRMACEHSWIIRSVIKWLPEWLQPKLDKENDHEIHFEETNCSIYFFAFEASKARALDYLFVDEAAFIKDMDQHWKCMFPTLSCGGNCVVTSTPNGNKGWFHDVYMGSVNGENDFHAVHWNFEEHPDYNNDDWIKNMKANLGDKGWRNEVLCEFIGSEETKAKPELEPHQEFFFVKSLKEEKDILHKCRKRAYENGFDPSSNIKDVDVNEAKLSHGKSYDEMPTTNVLFDNVNRPQSFFGYWWPNSAEEMAEEQIFLNEDYEMFNSIERKRGNLNDLEDRINNGVMDDLLALAGVVNTEELRSEGFSVINENIDQQLLEKITNLGDLPDTLKVSFKDSMFCINNVPTNIAEFDLCCLYNGLLAFTSHEKALKKVAKMVNNKIKSLFGTKGGE